MVKRKRIKAEYIRTLEDLLMRNASSADTFYDILSEEEVEAITWAIERLLR